MLCTEIVVAFVYFAMCQFLMLHRFVVNLCVTPHLHASWRGGYVGIVALRFSAPHSCCLGPVFTCLSLARACTRPTTYLRYTL